jgi:hypothetical protein
MAGAAVNNVMCVPADSCEFRGVAGTNCTPGCMGGAGPGAVAVANSVAGAGASAGSFSDVAGADSCGAGDGAVEGGATADDVEGATADDVDAAGGDAAVRSGKYSSPGDSSRALVCAATAGGIDADGLGSASI